MGLIPAHAGSTGDCPPGPHVQWAHPRSRGEHGLMCMGICDGEGLIPAHAGSTLFLTSAPQ